jgi:hypothetical protein
MEKGGHRNSWEGGKLLNLSCNFSFYEWVISYHCRIGLCFITRSSWSHSIGCLNWKRTLSLSLSQIPTSRTISSIGVRTSKLNWSSAWSEMTFSWITDQDRYMKARVRPWWHGLKVDWHHVGYLLKISDTWALTGKNGYKKALVKPHDMARWLMRTKECA